MSAGAMMPEHLVFTLAATFASFGDVAGHERRGSWTWPARSAILGLMGAALGLRREDDFTALDALSVSVAVFEAGEHLRDYHTVQTVPSAAVKAPRSRPQALSEGSGRLNTTITLRDYRTGVLYGVAVAGEPRFLRELAEALEHPVFQLYLGRKACPLAAPLAPKVVEAETAEAALAYLALPPWWPKDRRTAHRLIEDASDPAALHVELRHDQPIDRRRWHFASRAFTTRTARITPML